MYTDPIADLLTRVRNAYKARKDVVTLPYSKIKLDILKVLKDRKFISDFQKVQNNEFEEIEITLLEGMKDLTLKRVSKPGQRIYVSSSAIKKVNGGLGVAVLSTHKGVMSGEEAQKQNLGGEIICEIY